MSEITWAVIQMPFKLAMESELSRPQFHSIAQALMAECDRLKAENEALRRQVSNMSPFKNTPLTGPDTKCLACGGYHYGLGGLQCPVMKVTAQADHP